MKIYTKTGDDGTTSLFDGTRVKKDHMRVCAYGDVDELNSVIGLAASFVTDTSLQDQLFAIQKDLFALGAGLANPKHKKQKDKADFDETKVAHLEQIIDQIDEKLPEMTSFILPTGTPAASSLHLARTVCRRAERHLVNLRESETIEDVYIHYLNRLADLLFVLARYANSLEDRPDTPW